MDQIVVVGVLRTVDDADGLRAELTRGAARVVVIGTGFIGAEVAATCRALGHPVTVVEAAPVPLAAALGPELGAVCGGLHVGHGVRLLTGTTVAEWLATVDGAGRRRVTGLVLGTGERLPADVVVVGVGMQPAVAGWPARACRWTAASSPTPATSPTGPRGRGRRRRPAVEPPPGPPRAPRALDGRGRGARRRRAEPAGRAHRAARGEAGLLSGPTSTACASSSPARRSRPTRSGSSTPRRTTGPSWRPTTAAGRPPRCWR